MHLAYPLPWWLAVLLAGAIAAAAFLEYRRPLAPLTRLCPSKPARALVAAFVGTTRLIDNVPLDAVKLP